MKPVRTLQTLSALGMAGLLAGCGSEFTHVKPGQSARQVLASPQALAVRIADQGGSRPIPEPAAPDLDAKLAGLQAPRGWGLYLIKNLVDEMHIGGDATQHTIELILYLEGEGHGRETL